MEHTKYFLWIWSYFTLVLFQVTSEVNILNLKFSKNYCSHYEYKDQKIKKNFCSDFRALFSLTFFLK